MKEDMNKKVMLDNGKQLIVRVAQQQDAEKLICFVKQVTKDSKYLLLSDGEFSMNIEQEEAWIKSSEEDPGAIILVGEIDSKVVAITNAKNGSRKRNSHIAHLGTSVAEDFQGQGVGKVMMRELCNWAKSNPLIEYLELSVMGDNLIAQNLYKKVGFEVMAEIPNSYKYEDGTYQNNVVMRLRTQS